MSIRKTVLLILALALASALLAACMNDNGTELSSTPEPTNNFMPDNNGNGTGAGNGNGTAGTGNGTAGTGTGSGNATGTGATDGGLNGAGGGTGATGNTASSTDGALVPFDWANSAAGIEQAISQISELSEARVVVTNTTALVGVKFDNAYKGQLTERIREMVAAEVLKADPNIQTVAVTSDDEDVAKVYDLSDKIRAGRTADELSSEINAIVRNATTLR